MNERCTESAPDDQQGSGPGSNGNSGTSSDSESAGGSGAGKGEGVGISLGSVVGIAVGAVVATLLLVVVVVVVLRRNGAAAATVHGSAEAPPFQNPMYNANPHPGLNGPTVPSNDFAESSPATRQSNPMYLPTEA